MNYTKLIILIYVYWRQVDRDSRRDERFQRHCQSRIRLWLPRAFSSEFALDEVSLFDSIVCAWYRRLWSELHSGSWREKTEFPNRLKRNKASWGYFTVQYNQHKPCCISNGEHLLSYEKHEKPTSPHFPQTPSIRLFLPSNVHILKIKELPSRVAYESQFARYSRKFSPLLSRDPNLPWQITFKIHFLALPFSNFFPGKQEEKPLGFTAAVVLWRNHPLLDNLSKTQSSETTVLNWRSSVTRAQFPLSSNPISQSVYCLLTLLLCAISSLGLGLFVSPLEPLLLVRFREGMGGLVSTGLKETLWRVNTFDECTDWPVPSRSAEDTRKRWLAELVSGEIEDWLASVESVRVTWLLKAVPLDLEKKKAFFLKEWQVTWNFALTKSKVGISYTDSVVWTSAYLRAQPYHPGRFYASNCFGLYSSHSHGTGYTFRGKFLQISLTGSLTPQMW